MKKKVLHFRRNKRSSKNQRIRKDKKFEISNPTDFDIQEVKTPSDRVTEKGGTIELWKSLEIQEKLKMRVFLTYSTTLLWISWTAIGLIDYLHTGNPFLLVTSPPVGGLLLLIFKFYFK